MNVFTRSTFVSSTSGHRVHDRNALNSFALKCLRTTFFATEAWGAAAAPILDPSPPTPGFSFQRLTHCPICKLFLLMTLQQYPGVCTPLASGSLRFNLDSLPRCSKSLLTAHSVISVLRKHRCPHSSPFSWRTPPIFESPDSRTPREKVAELARPRIRIDQGKTNGCVYSSIQVKAELLPKGDPFCR